MSVLTCSWRVLRVQALDPMFRPESVELDRRAAVVMPTDTWCDDMDDWGDGDASSTDVLSADDVAIAAQTQETETSVANTTVEATAGHMDEAADVCVASAGDGAIAEQTRTTEATVVSTGPMVEETDVCVVSPGGGPIAAQAREAEATVEGTGPMDEERVMTGKMSLFTLSSSAAPLTDGPAALPAHYVNVIDEADYKPSEDLTHAEHLMRDYDRREGVDVRGTQHGSVLQRY